MFYDLELMFIWEEGLLKTIIPGKLMKISLSHRLEKSIRKIRLSE